MNAAYERLIQHLDERDLRYQADNSAGSICVDFRVDVGTYRVVAAVDENGELFEVFGYAPVRVPEGARPSVAETVVRANYGLRVGKLEMDYDDGDICFQVAHVLTNGVLDDGIIARSFGAAMAMLDRCLPAVLSVIYGNELPKDAVRNVEQPDAREPERTTLVSRNSGGSHYLMNNAHDSTVEDFTTILEYDNTKSRCVYFGEHM